jgi:hypothetical protein
VWMASCCSWGGVAAVHARINALVYDGSEEAAVACMTARRRCNTLAFTRGTVNQLCCDLTAEGSCRWLVAMH